MKVDLSKVEKPRFNEPLQINEHGRNKFEELIMKACCPKCGSEKIGFLDLGLDSPIKCYNCGEVF